MSWLSWEAKTRGAGMPKSVAESLGVYRERLHPQGSPVGIDGWWDVSDEESARAPVADTNAQLDRAGWPVLERMFSRDAMMAHLRDDPARTRQAVRRVGSHRGRHGVI